MHYKLPMIVLSIIFRMLSLDANAQQCGIKGHVKSTDEIEGLIVNLFQHKDSFLLKTTFTTKEGNFEFENIQPGKYFIVIQLLNFMKYAGEAIQLDSGIVTLPGIVLHPNTNTLNDIQINSRKKFVEKKIDRIIVNPDALISNAGTNVLEALEKAPGIIVDMNGNISLKGKQGIVVFVDDKPTYLSSSDLSNYLRSLPTGSVETIELITNPPAKYDAAGNAGIINIRMKKSIAKGINGGLNVNYGQGVYARSNNSATFNYRINKLNLFSNVSYGNNISYQDLTINRYYYTDNGIYQSGFSQHSFLKKYTEAINVRIGADYYVNKSSTIGFVASGFNNSVFSPVKNNAFLSDSVNNPINFIQATNPTHKKWKNGTLNFNFSCKPGKKNTELMFNADYLIYDATTTQELNNKVSSVNGVLLTNSILQSSLPSVIEITSVKADFSQPLKKSDKIESGVKYSLVNTDNTGDFYDVVNNVITPNYQFSNQFKYKEAIGAAYMNYSHDWKKIALQLGLRVENTHINGNQFGNPLINDSTYSVTYTSLFPTFYLLIKPDSAGKHQIGISMGRRINRPNYQDMNPFTYPLDRFTYYGGNPFLQPTFSYNIEASHTFKNIITTTFDYSISNNLIQETNEQRGNIYYSRPGNFGRQVVFGLSVNGNLPIQKWWLLQLYSEIKNIIFRSDVYGQVLDESRLFAYAGPTNIFTINDKFSVELGGSYQTRILSGQFLTIPVWSARVGVSHKILKGKGTLKWNLSDIFYSNQQGGDIRNIANSKADWLSFFDSRVVSIGLSYRFNKGKTLAIRKTGAAEDEKGRIKTN